MTDPHIPSLTSTVQELINAAKDFNAGQIQMVYRNSQDQPIAAVIVVRGEWAQDVLKAIDQLENSLEEDKAHD